MPHTKRGRCLASGDGSQRPRLWVLQFNITDAQQAVLNPRGVNVLRYFPGRGNLVWGARTCSLDPDWKYVNVRRLVIFLEESIKEATQWVVFEPNDETLWGQLRMNIGAFMQGLFLKGAFQGASPQQAYFVKCDSENNTQANIDLGIVTVTVGFAPLYPAEFVVIQIQQMARQL